ncbi:protein kinase C-binding protein NELL1 [Hyalella azteca]|uniref:Protein kinase C-binding protein NELL1 n=1 Tax=Hyalella azteca TaxID=294128 RepID=A0A8B7NLU3_HYAAZ|nr:protein kinase C-binding protein NELL1 [Hyalella azteca]
MGAAMVFFMLCIISGGMTSTLEVEGFCNVQVSVQSGSSCKCRTSSLLYDYSVNDCVAKDILYPVTECGPNADLQTCECKDGWARDSVTGLCIQEAEQCQADSCAKDDEKCVELPGVVHCACLDTQYKASDTHCVPYNECSNPMWNDCTQICLDDTVGYHCLCAKNFEGNGTHCEIQENYIDCSNETFVCSRFANGSVVVQFPRIGFLANGTDKDECNEPQNTFCWPNSVCVNLDAGGGYQCQCKPGYTDYNSTLRECIFIDQPHCSGCACEDVCADETCNNQSLVCDSSASCASDCVISLADTVLTLPVTTVGFYTGTLTVGVPQYNYHANNVHKALSAVLGRNVQVRSRSNAVFEFSVMTSSFRLANS